MNKKKKIGILSMQRINNYGSYMQALGLKLLLEEVGSSSVFVDYHIGPWYSKKNFKNTILYKKFRSLFEFVKNSVPNPEQDAIKSQFYLLGLDEKYHYRTKVDTLILGSDEVFNYIQKGDNVGYSPELIGINNRASEVISYAASCGNLTLDRLEKFGKIDEFSDAMKKLSRISVRDDNTFNVVKKCTGIEPQIHLDPVLVADFSCVFEDKVSIKDYILVYGYTNRFSNEEGNYLKRYAHEHEKKLIALGGYQSFCDDTIFCKPSEVVSFFKHADFVVTDTFHGTIFSIISEKNFVTIVRDGEEGNSNKINCLLTQLNLNSKRLINLYDFENIINKKIDYAEVEKIRLQERKRSLEYLSNI